MTDSPYVFDVTQANFEASVVHASMQTPVLVDFWAPWCAPCRQLKPVLEKLTVDQNGALKLAKVNTDQEMQLAAMFGIRSLPTVVLFKNGQMVDGFMGALPESALREFLGRHLGAQTGSPADETIEAVAETIDEPEETAAEVVQRLRIAIAAEPTREELKFDLAAALLRAGDHDAALSEIDALPANLSVDARAKRVRGQIEFARAVEGAPTAAELTEHLARQPDDHRARHQLGVRQLLAGDAAAALETFLDLLRRDRTFGEGLAKKSLLAAFHLVEDADLVSQIRRRMASLLF